MRTIALKYRVTALLTACLMLVSSTGFAMDMHFCQDMLKSVRLIGEAPNCHEQASKTNPALSCHKNQPAPACHSNAETAAKSDCKKDCCSHEVVLAQLDTDFLKSENVQTTLAAFVVCVLHATFSLAYDFSTQAHHQEYLHYKPPAQDRDIPILVQSFLI